MEEEGKRRREQEKGHRYREKPRDRIANSGNISAVELSITLSSPYLTEREKEKREEEEEGKGWGRDIESERGQTQMPWARRFIINVLLNYFAPRSLSRPPPKRGRGKKKKKERERREREGAGKKEQFAVAQDKRPIRLPFSVHLFSSNQRGKKEKRKRKERR